MPPGFLSNHSVTFAELKGLDPLVQMAFFTLHSIRDAVFTVIKLPHCVTRPQSGLAATPARSRYV